MLVLDEGPKPVQAGDVFVLRLRQGTAHDLRNTGSEPLRIIAFFSARKVEQHWTTEVWEPGALKITGTLNSRTSPEEVTADQSARAPARDPTFRPTRETVPGAIRSHMPARTPNK